MFLKSFLLSFLLLFKIPWPFTHSFLLRLRGTDPWRPLPWHLLCNAIGWSGFPASLQQFYHWCGLPAPQVYRYGLNKSMHTWRTHTFYGPAWTSISNSHESWIIFVFQGHPLCLTWVWHTSWWLCWLSSSTMCWWRDSACTPESLWVSSAGRISCYRIFCCYSFINDPLGISGQNMRQKRKIHSAVILWWFLFIECKKLYQRPKSPVAVFPEWVFFPPFFFLLFTFSSLASALGFFLAFKTF